MPGKTVRPSFVISGEGRRFTSCALGPVSQLVRELALLLDQVMAPVVTAAPLCSVVVGSLVLEPLKHLFVVDAYLESFLASSVPIE